MKHEPLSILVLGDSNTLCSQIAEAYLRSLGPHLVTPTSAGLRQGTRHPLLEQLLAEDEISAEGLRAKAASSLGERSFDLILTVSEAARQVATTQGRIEAGGEAPLCLFIGTPVRLHWELPTFAETSDSREQLEALRGLRKTIRSHVVALLEQGYVEALAAERRRSRMLVDTLEMGIVVHDERRRIYIFNTAAEQLTGKKREDVLGRDCHSVFPPDGICGSHCAFQHGKPDIFTRRDYKVAFTSTDGTGRLVRMRSSPMEVHEGRPAEVVAQVTDVTEIDSLRWQMKERHSLHGMVGESQAMRGVFEIIRQVATSDYPVLITGESGTGKELAAHAIHLESRRAEGPFVPINCGALPEHILESELFGHVRGAFTGAIRDKKGRFELASGGTIFLDEVGELTPAFQVKLLRVLQEMRFERVGGEQPVEVDVRVISATNRDLRTMVRTKNFREDLFYRLCVVPIELPPLRERHADIPLLVNHILERIRRETNQPDITVANAAMDLLLNHPWPGNVRELINALQFAAVRSPGKEIGEQHLPPEVKQGTSPFTHSASASSNGFDSVIERKRSRKKLDMDSVVAALGETAGNKVQAAKLLGVGRATLYRFLNDHPLPDSIRKIN